MFIFLPKWLVYMGFVVDETATMNTGTVVQTSASTTVAGGSGTVSPSPEDEGLRKRVKELEAENEKLRDMLK